MKTNSKKQVGTIPCMRNAKRVSLIDLRFNRINRLIERDSVMLSPRKWFRMEVQ